MFLVRSSIVIFILGFRRKALRDSLEPILKIPGSVAECPLFPFTPSRTHTPRKEKFTKNRVEFAQFLCYNRERGGSVHSFSFLFVMKRSAFTLVELLVVIAVIALLVAILIPVVNGAREHARRTQCMTQQRSLAIAMVTYDRESDGLPGYLNQLGETPLRSWVVSILLLIGENERYATMTRVYPTQADREEAVKQAIVPLPALLCPSDRPDGLARLNYVVNCGPEAELFPVGVSGGDIAPHFTLFKDRRGVLPLPLPPVALASINKKVKIEEIPDGASYTILLSENVDAGVWHQGEAQLPDELRTSSLIPTRDSDAVANFGFVWVPDWAATPLPGACAPNSPSKGPRPSSRHPGTVIAAFADGTARAINDNVSQAEWFRFVCPDDEKAKNLFSNGGLR